MAGYKPGGTGTLMIDWAKDPIGRIQRRSGTTDEATFKEILIMLDSLRSTGKHEILREIQDGTIKPIEALVLYRDGALATAITVKKNLPILETVTRYLDTTKELTPGSIKNYRHNLKRFVERFPNGQLHELPKLLAKYRAETMKAGEGYRTFDLTRSLFQGFLNNSKGFGPNSPLWKAVSEVKPIKSKAKKLAPLDVKEYKQLRAALTRDQFKGKDHDTELFRKMLDSLIFTGMNKDEYYQHKYEVKDDRLLIHGTKRDARERVTPRWITPVRARINLGFERKLREVGLKSTGKKCNPLVFRHTFASWMERANIPQTRRDLYMGHAGKGIGSIYTWVQVEEFLEEDYATFAAWYERMVHEIKNPPAKVKRVDLSTI
jgi:integrase